MSKWTNKEIEKIDVNVKRRNNKNGGDAGSRTQVLFANIISDYTFIQLVHN